MFGSETCVDDAARFSAPADVDCQKAVITPSLTSSSSCLGGGGGGVRGAVIVSTPSLRKTLTEACVISRGIKKEDADIWPRTKQ